MFILNSMQTTKIGQTSRARERERERGREREEREREREREREGGKEGWGNVHRVISSITSP